MTRTLLLAGVVVVLAGCASGEGVADPAYDFGSMRRTAVVQVEGAVSTNAARNDIADIFNMELMAKGYGPVLRMHMDALLAEQEFQASDLTSPDGMAEAGKILNVKAIVLVNVSSSGQKVTLTAKLVDVEDGRIAWQGRGTGSAGRNLATLVGATAGAGAGILLGGDRTGAVVGGAMGGILGGAAGYGLSANEAKLIRKVVHEMCESLPVNPRAAATGG